MRGPPSCSVRREANCRGVGRPAKFVRRSVEFRLESAVRARREVGGLEFFERRHQRFRNVSAAVRAEAASRIRNDCRNRTHDFSVGRCEPFTARISALILAASFLPGDFSVPLQTSIAYGRTIEMASRTFSGVMPPARKIRGRFFVPRTRDQSNVFPVPPRSLPSKPSSRIADAFLKRRSCPALKRFSHTHGFDYWQRTPETGNGCRRFVAVQLDVAEPDFASGFEHACLVLVHEHADGSHTLRQTPHDPARLGWSDVPGTSRIKIEAQEISSRLASAARVGPICDSADFHFHFSHRQFMRPCVPRLPLREIAATVRPDRRSSSDARRSERHRTRHAAGEPGLRACAGRTR